ncbi:hypothetical protein JL722_6022 [Aureococcus anophagefferens]|nr:hypothetical protein JL722_6022 [Aureococcus anophagefferens]
MGGRHFAALVCALTSAFQRPQAPRAPRAVAVPALNSLPPTPEDAEDEVSWRRSVTSADFDDALVYRLFRRQFEILLPGFVPKKQLAVSARRGKASLRRLRLNATALNRFVSIAWTSVFTLNRDPLEVRINKVEFEFDQGARKPTKYQLGEAKREWDALAPAPAAFMNEYPTIEGARFLVDELVCVARRVEAPFPRGGNSTVRLTLRGVDARSVDNASAVVDLRRCWASYNPAPNAAAAFIAKRRREALVEICVEIKFDDRDASEADPAATASAAATAAAADATAPEVAEDGARWISNGRPDGERPRRLVPREETTPDRLWLLRRRREAAGGAANWSVTRTSDDWEPPRVEFSKNSEDDGFVVLARAPAPAALLTVGYDSPRAEVKSIRVDLDLRRFRLALDSDLLGARAPKPGDVSLGVFALFGDSRPAALRPAPSKVGAVGDALSAVLNRIVRPAAALLRRAPKCARRPPARPRARRRARFLALAAPAARAAEAVGPDALLPAAAGGAKEQALAAAAEFFGGGQRGRRSEAARSEDFFGAGGGGAFAAGRRGSISDVISAQPAFRGGGEAFDALRGRLDAAADDFFALEDADGPAKAAAFLASAAPEGPDGEDDDLRASIRELEDALAARDRDLAAAARDLDRARGRRETRTVAVGAFAATASRSAATDAPVTAASMTQAPETRAAATPSRRARRRRVVRRAGDAGRGRRRRGADAFLWRRRGRPAKRSAAATAAPDVADAASGAAVDFADAGTDAPAARAFRDAERTRTPPTATARRAPLPPPRPETRPGSRDGRAADAGLRYGRAGDAVARGRRRRRDAFRRLQCGAAASVATEAGAHFLVPARGYVPSIPGAHASVAVETDALETRDAAVEVVASSSSIALDVPSIPGAHASIACETDAPVTAASMTQAPETRDSGGDAAPAPTSADAASAAAPATRSTGVDAGDPREKRSAGTTAAPAVADAASGTAVASADAGTDAPASRAFRDAAACEPPTASAASDARPLPPPPRPETHDQEAATDAPRTRACGTDAPATRSRAVGDAVAMRSVGSAAAPDTSSTATDVPSIPGAHASVGSAAAPDTSSSATDVPSIPGAHASVGSAAAPETSSIATDVPSIPGAHASIAVETDALRRATRPSTRRRRR